LNHLLIAAQIPGLTGLMNVLYLDFGKLFRLFQRVNEFQLRLIAGGADGELYFNVTFDLFGLNAYDADTSREDAFQIHEHLGPIEAARLENAIDKISAGIQLGDLFLPEIPLQFRFLLFELSHLLARFFGARAEFRVDFPDGVDVPAQQQKNEAGDNGGKPRARKEFAVGFQRLGR
jgi:hypothetical protein